MIINNIDLDPRIVWALTDHAERRGTNIQHLIAGMVTKVFTPTATGSAPTFRDKVETEWGRGAPDAVIAHRLGEPVEAVRTARRSLGLKPHKFRREQWVHELTPSTQPPASSGVTFTQGEAA